MLELIIDYLRDWLPRRPLLADRAIFCAGRKHRPAAACTGVGEGVPTAPQSEGNFALHWPLLRLMVLQDVETGLALRPYWGPETVSEQALGREAMAHLPPQAVVLEDRNFGVFGVAWTFGPNPNMIFPPTTLLFLK